MGIQKDKLNEDQKKEIERLRSFVARNRLNAQMNGTKWRAAIDAIQALPGYQASFRVKCITDTEEPIPNQWDEAFPENIPLYNSIEWLELNPWGAGSRPNPIPQNVPKKLKPINFSDALKRELEAVKIPIVLSPTGIRIIGHSRPEKK